MSKEINKNLKVFSESEVTTRIVAAFRQTPLALQDKHIALALRAQPFLHDINSARITEQYAAKLWETEGASQMPTEPIPQATLSDLQTLERLLIEEKIDTKEAIRRANQLPLC